MAETFEQGGDGVDAGFEGIDLGQQFIEFLGDAGLFGYWWEWHSVTFKVPFGDMHHPHAMGLGVEVINRYLQCIF
ncbi:hypothetical protein D3C85_1782940 [compost metagenome]